MKRLLSIFLTVLLCVTLTTTLALAQDADIYVDANEGNDKTGDGSQVSPYKTITQAVEVANDSSTHNTIHIEKGVYNLSSGEDFPLTVKNVDLIGNPDDLEAVKVAGKMTVKESKVRGIHFYRTVTVEDNTILQNNAFSGIRARDGAVRVEGSSKIRRNSFYNNSTAIDSSFVPRGPFEITNNIFSNNAYAISGFHFKGHVLIASNQVKGSESGFGLKVFFRGENSKATIRDNVVDVEHLAVRLRFRSRGEALIEDNELSGAISIALTDSSSALVDLGGGPLNSSGNNIFQASEYFLEYKLPPYNGEIYAKNNTWKDAYGNAFQPPTTLEGPADTDHFLIEDEGNMIIFSD